jgi:hypothetical protein
MFAFSDWVDVGVGYGLTFAAIAVLAARVLLKGRRLSRIVPDEDKPWV